MYLEKYHLKDKVAIITGASRGIGKAIACGFSEAGAKVVLASRKIADLEKVAGEISAAGREVFPIAAHNGKLADLENLVSKTIEKFKNIDILVNNAGTNPVFGPVLNCDEPVWDKIFEVNLKGYFFLSKEVTKYMAEKGGGSIINMASVAGHRPTPGLGVYSISKAGVIMLTKVCASEWASLKIRVNAIAPGLVQTKFSQALWDNEVVMEEVKRRMPMQRIGQPEEIVGAALYLASEASSFVTGQTLVVDGGEDI
ncbi:MAG: glucose 1-dehydrogenase [Deltaproteobacteria bacterium]|nr:MAG: glucose 1-dehydrogenase [Deltaproteobacteria bacterium]